MTSVFKSNALFLLVFGILLIVLGLVGTIPLYSAWRNTTALKKEPRHATLRDIIANGVGDNPHVIVSGYTCGNDFAYEAVVQKGAPVPPKDDFYTLKRGWIPLYPVQGEVPTTEAVPTSFAALLETPQTKTSTQGLHVQSRNQSIEAVIMPLSDR